MKKILIVLLVLLLTGCVSNNSSSNVNSPNTDPTGVRQNVANLFSYDDYLEFVKSDTDVPLSSKFVFYEDGLSEIGEFKSLVIMDKTHCFYQFKDANDFLLSLYINDISNDEELIEKYAEETAAAAADDLREIDASTAALLPKYSIITQYSNEGVKYYNNGSAIYVYDKDSGYKCTVIRWCSKGTEYILTCFTGNNPGMDSLSEYPKDGVQTFVSKLFDADTAKETVESFNTTIAQKKYSDASVQQ